MTTAYDFSFTGIDGQPLPLSRFAGKALMVINVASKCGLTPQYEGLQKLWLEYQDKGLVLIGVPCNQFMWQEPAKETEIAAFCRVNYAITFPMTSKEHVRGGKAHPYFKWMREKLGSSAKPNWNFHKLLTDRAGQPSAAFPSRMEPSDPKLRAGIEAALRQPVLA